MWRYLGRLVIFFLAIVVYAFLANDIDDYEKFCKRMWDRL